MAAKTIRITNDPRSAVAAAAEILRNGGVLLFPTETVYGIGVMAGLPAALEKLRRLKQRPDEKPFQFLAADAKMAESIGAVFSEKAKRLAETFWPGPLTLVVPKAHSAQSAAGAADATLGIRVPASAFILAVCRALGAPVISSSANPAGLPPPARAAAADCFGNEVDLLIDGDAITKGAAGIPSTVVRCYGEKYEILREGGIPRSSIDSVWNAPTKKTERTPRNA